MPVVLTRPGDCPADPAGTHRRARFEGLAGEGCCALAADAPGLAAAELRAALALWRGAPLADLSDELFAQVEIARLEELRAGVIEDRIEADLALGRHADVVSELGALVAARPLRERLYQLLMIALYRCGRQSEALAVYQSARRVLVQELGIEPGPALRRVENAILEQDVSLDLPARATRPQAVAPAGDERPRSAGAHRGRLMTAAAAVLAISLAVLVVGSSRSLDLLSLWWPGRIRSEWSMALGT